MTPESAAKNNAVVLAQVTEEPVAHLSQSFPAEVLYWKDLILEASERYGLDPNLYASLIKEESWTYDTRLCPDGPVLPSCTSYADAIGIAQVMYFHFGCESPEDCEIGRDPRTNIFKGAEILAEYISQKGGDWRIGLASYNAGPNWIDFPTDSLNYADRVLAWYKKTNDQ